MNPDTCPRCGLPEHWQVKLRVRLVFAAIGLAGVFGFIVGRRT